MELLLVHSGIDGIAAAVLAIASNYGADIFAASANVLNKYKMMKYDIITIVDMAIDEAMLKELIACGKTVRIFDHHARNHFINHYENCIMDSRFCATKIFYDNDNVLVHSKAADKFIEMVDLVDRWQVFDKKFDWALQILHLFNGMYDKKSSKYWIVRDNKHINNKYYSFIDSCVNKLLFTDDFRFQIDDRLIIDAENKKIDDDYNSTLCSLQVRIDSRNRIFGLCEKFGNPSIIMARLLIRNADLNYLIAYEATDEDRTRVYARSRNIKSDMNELAGLEGHPTAAGGLLNTSFVRRLVENRIRYIPLTNTKKSKYQRGLTPYEMKHRR